MAERLRFIRFDLRPSDSAFVLATETRFSSGVAKNSFCSGHSCDTVEPSVGETTTMPPTHGSTKANTAAYKIKGIAPSQHQLSFMELIIANYSGDITPPFIGG